MLPGCKGELIEGGEEVIVAGLLARQPVAHRPGIYHLPIQNMVLVGASHRGLVGVFLTGVAGRKNEVRGRVIDAQPILGRVVDK